MFSLSVVISVYLKKKWENQSSLYKSMEIDFSCIKENHAKSFCL